MKSYNEARSIITLKLSAASISKHLTFEANYFLWPANEKEMNNKDKMMITRKHRSNPFFLLSDNHITPVSLLHVTWQTFDCKRGANEILFPEMHSVWKIETPPPPSHLYCLPNKKENKSQVSTLSVQNEKNTSWVHFCLNILIYMLGSSGDLKNKRKYLLLSR